MSKMLLLKPRPRPIIPSLHSYLISFLFTTSMEQPTQPTTTQRVEPMTTVEHIVLLKIRATADPTQISAMLARLRSLSSLPVLTHLTAGPVLRLRSPLGFTHLLHCRYPSIPDLAAYTVHPNHVAAVRENAPIIEDVTAVDWIVDRQLPAPKPGSALRLVLAKAAVDMDIVVKAAGKGELVSFGDNFSPGRAKGFTVGGIAVFPSVEEMEGEGDMGVVVDDVAVVDYVVPFLDSPDE